MMVNRITGIVLAGLLGTLLAGERTALAKKHTGLAVYPPSVKLRAGDSQQLAVVDFADKVVDHSRAASYASRHPALLSVSPAGLIQGLQPGTTSVRIELDGTVIERTVTVLPAASKLSFLHDVVPVFSSKGCNLGVCHGKATGQRGFKLSLFGTDPGADYRALTKESRGRRLFPAAPERSLLLLKATASRAHGGGMRFGFDSPEYQSIARWVAEGMVAPAPTDHPVVQLECYPDNVALEQGAQQQIVVTARDAVGNSWDVTREVVFVGSDPQVATIDGSGLVSVIGNGGLFSVLIRHGPLTTTFQCTIPYPRDREQHAEQVRNYETLETEFRDNQIDQLMLQQWRRLQLTPSPQASDEEFIRRVSVDICGTLPTPEEVTVYRQDNARNKREALIDRLLERPAFANYFAVKWADILQNRGRGYSTNKQRPGTSLFYGWIRDSIAQNTPYDQFAGDIVSASGSQSENPPAVWYRSVRTLPSYVESVSQAFLGVRVQCAQCHHHPFDRWTQADYFGLAAVFARVGRKGGFADAEVPTSEVIFLRDEGEVVHPKTGEVLKPRPLGGPDFELGPFEDPRHALAAWFSDPENPFFARAMVNRMWAHFLGHGLINPIDDARATNPASNPPLLELLSKRFIESGFNRKQLIRDICSSHAYGLESRPTPLNGNDNRSFARFYPRRMTAEVLLDGISQVLDVPTEFSGGGGKFPVGTRAIELPDENVPVHFLDVFGRPARNKACECERVSEATLGQALALVNSAMIQDKLTSEAGYVAHIIDSGMAVEEKVKDVFLRVLSRDPSEKEINIAVEFLEAENDKASAYRSFVWSLLATNEFLFNH